MSHPKRIKKLCIFLAFSVISCLLMRGSIFAQTTTATLEGVVTDERGVALPGVALNLKNIETGNTKTGITGAEGKYIISGILPGKYECVVSISGFTTQIRRGLTISIGARLKIDFGLKQTTLEAEITVIAESPMVEVSKSEVGSVVDRGKIDDLPLFNRSFGDLIIMKAGVQYGRANAQPRGTGETIVDGVSLEWVGTNEDRSTIPADAIQEFRVITNQFQAELGNASGLVRSAITRSGTNKLRGRTSYFFRDELFDSVSYFVNHATYEGPELPKDKWQKSPYIHNNFGGFLGGPIITDKAHFFLCYDGFRDEAYTTITSPLVARETNAVDSSVNEFLLKLNYQPSEKHAFAFRYTLYDGVVHNLGPGGYNTKTTSYNSVVRTHDFQLNWTFYPSDSTMNEFRVLYANTLNDVPANYPGTYAIARPSGNFGKPANVPQQTIENRYQFVDNFSIFAGNHSIKLGVDASRVPLYGYVNQYLPGYYIFTTDAPFDPAVFATYPYLLAYNTGDPNFSVPYTAIGIFAQDSWRIHPRLTLNLGLRYNYYLCKGLDMDNANIRNFNPRIGFSWDPWGDGKTSIRGGVGTFSNNPILNAGLVAMILNQMKVKYRYYPGYPDPAVPNPFFPQVLETDVPLAKYGAVSNEVAPYTLQTTLGVQRELWTDFSIGVDLVWAGGYRLMRLENYNPIIVGTTSVHVDKTIADYYVITDNGSSDYTGMYFTLTKRHSHGWAIEIAYTLSRSWSDVEQENAGQHSYEPDVWEKRYGPTTRDARHRLAVTGIYDLPWGFQLSGMMYYRSATPWNAIHKTDWNKDGLIADYIDARYNSRRGFDEFYLNLRISKFLTIGRFRFQVFAETYNTTDRVNFSGIVSYLEDPNFGKPVAAGGPRLVQLGARIDF